MNFNIIEEMEGNFGDCAKRKWNFVRIKLLLSDSIGQIDRVDREFELEGLDSGWVSDWFTSEF